jgi:hypothetical protein
MRHHRAEGSTEDTYADTFGYTAPVRRRVYKHGTLGGYATAECRCEGCRQRAREYGRERMRQRRSADSAPPERRWAKSRDADEPYGTLGLLVLAPGLPRELRFHPQTLLLELLTPRQFSLQLGPHSSLFRHLLSPCRRGD